MLFQALLALSLVFVAAFAARFVAVFRRARWMAPALTGLAVLALTFRLGVASIVLAIGAGAYVWWQSRPRQPKRAADTVDAREIAAAQQTLGVRSGATEEDIRMAHRAKIKAAHPDHGGDEAAAAHINFARDVLIRALRQNRDTPKS
jgi:ABC-type nickel/cobalt efflux system permease component RcnA